MGRAHLAETAPQGTTDLKLPGGESFTLNERELGLLKGAAITGSEDAAKILEAIKRRIYTREVDDDGDPADEIKPFFELDDSADYRVVNSIRVSEIQEAIKWGAYTPEEALELALSCGYIEKI